jgi:ubiquinone/menaquinone biosynthesis C-methylase UbiE
LPDYRLKIKGVNLKSRRKLRIMANEKKVKLEPNAVYKINIWFWKFTDLIWNPRLHLKKIPLKEGMKVVDYGCGPGRYAIPIAELVGPKGKVFAVDIQPLAIKTVKEKAARQGLTNIEPILVDSYDTGIQDSSIDLVLLIDTFHQIGDRDALLREIHRILKPGGFLFMDPGHMKLSRAREIVEGAGLFTIIECQGKDMLVAPKTKQRNSG